MRAAAGAALLLSGLGRAGAAQARLPAGFAESAALSGEDLEGYGINPAFIVAVRLAGDGRAVVAEHRPGRDSALHVIRPNGAYGYKFDVPSPQLADFSVDAGGKVFLVGSLGTRFLAADLEARKARRIMSSLPDRPGFRALPPVSILRSEGGPVVYGLFYDSKDASRELGFARVAENGTALNALPTGDWDARFGVALSILPDPRLESALIVAQEAPKGDGRAAGPKRLILAKPAGEGREIDSADDVFGLAWSPGGSLFAYVRRRGSTQELVAASALGMAPTVLGRGAYFSPVFLNEGKTLLVAAKEDKGMSLWAMRLPSGGLERVPLPEGPCIYVTGPSGAGFAAWGRWGLRMFELAGE